MGIPRKIHRVWLGDAVPDEFQHFEDRWRDLHPDWEVRTWRDDDFGWLTNQAAFDDARLFSSKSNIARYEVIFREGGLYVDCDIEPLRSIDELLEGADLVLSEESPGLYGNELFAAVPQHPVIASVVAELPESHFSRPDAISPERTGPHFWTRCVRRRCAELGLQPRILTHDQVYPYSWTQPHLRGRTFPEAWVVHHWAQSWVTPTPTPVTPPPSRGRRWAGRAARAGKAAYTEARARWDAVEPTSIEPPPIPFAVYLGDGCLLARTSRGFPVVVPTHETDGDLADLVLDGALDADYSDFLEREIGKGDVVVDVGAGTGVHALQVGFQVRETGRVFVYESDPRRATLIGRSIEMNRARGLVADLTVSGGVVGRGDDRTVALDDAFRGIAELALVRVDVAGTTGRYSTA